jgi:hypothetical protein
MFLKSSRYTNVPQVETTDSRGRPVQAIKLRTLPDTNGADILVDNSLQLDVMAKRNYRDGTKFWHIADANTQLEANALVAVVGSVIKQPES